MRLLLPRYDNERSAYGIKVSFCTITCCSVFVYYFVVFFFSINNYLKILGNNACKVVYKNFRPCSKWK